MDNQNCTHQKKFLGFHIDSIGFTTSFLCAIHCAIVPVLLVIAPIAGLQYFENPIIDILMLGASFTLASFSLLNGHFKRHKKYKAIAYMIFGFGIIGASFSMKSKSDEAILATAGAITVAISHIINWKLCQKFIKKK